MSGFEHWAGCADAELDLARAALCIARDEYPQLDERACLDRLDAAARAVRSHAGAGAGAHDVLAALDRELFQLQGFAGNSAHYQDPRNSYLNEVIERRLGIPITLSVVYLEVGWRLGLALVPLGFPGHFLVGHPGTGGLEVIDPFHAGRRLGERDLLSQLARMVGPGQAAAALPRALAPVPRREVVARILRNLKAIHLQAGDWGRALRAADRLLTLSPDAASLLRERAQLYERVQAHRAAVEDYRRYLALAPDAPDAQAVRSRIAALAARTARLN